MTEVASCPVSAVLLDVDGVLVDSTGVHRRVWRSWARSRGLDVELVWRATFGRRPQDTVAATAPNLDLEAELRALDGLLRSREGEITAAPGATSLLRKLHFTPWAIVTSGGRDRTVSRFHRLGLPLPSVLVCGEDVEHGKPHPEGYLKASQELRVPAGECVVVEDSPAGIAAAHAAGCRVLAITTTHPPAACAEADGILADLHEVTAWMLAVLGLQ